MHRLSILPCLLALAAPAMAADTGKTYAEAGVTYQGGGTTINGVGAGLRFHF